MTTRNNIHTVLFDLDGTLADTAPDLTNALNKVRDEQGLEPISLETMRPHVSNGSIAITQKGFDIERDHPDFEPLRLRLLEHYLDAIAVDTTLFPQMHELLEFMEQQGIFWGVVTNKPMRFTDPLMEQLGLSQRAACIISGDTTAERKPHPLPLLHACEITGAAPEQCLYIGDAQRDIEAGLRAGMQTLVALFGYIQEGDNPATWNADGMVETPLDIINWI